jgi:lysophospholipid acyltransferase (LPLAT)-like uncharacterized protein
MIKMAAKRLSTFIIKHGFVPAAHQVIRFYLLLMKLKTVNEEKIIRHLKDGDKLVVALWHQRFFLVIRYAGRFGGYQPSAIISQSRDGELIAQLAKALHFRPIRGSSSKGGKAAMDALVEDLSHHSCAIHAVDGPRGPKGVVKPGLIRIAQRSGAAIVPVYISCSRVWKLKSWDQFLIPKPFSRILVHWGDPIDLPENMDSETFEKYRLEIEQRMQDGQRQADLQVGSQGLL